jgi:hypothetical protein
MGTRSEEINKYMDIWIYLGQDRYHVVIYKQ